MLQQQANETLGRHEEILWGSVLEMRAVVGAQPSVRTEKDSIEFDLQSERKS